MIRLVFILLVVLNFLCIVSGGVGLDAMFWYHNRQGEEDSWGAYAQARIWGEILWGLLSGEASLEGALIGAPRFTIYTVGTLRVEICWVEVFSGSLWVAIGEDGIDGGTGDHADSSRKCIFRNVSQVTG